MQTPSEPGLTLSDHPDRLTASLLCNTRWEYGAADGSPAWGTLQLVPFSLPWPIGNPRGRVVGFDHPNERLWELVNDTLMLLDDAGRPTTIFTHMRDTDGCITLLGRHRLQGGGVHQLRAVAALPRANSNAPLAIGHDLGRTSSTLLVRFNSLANPAPVMGPFRREYARIGESLGVDMLHFAEGDGEPSWFLRDRAEIERTLRDACAGRRTVILVGNSSGGYAALRFGEWLRAERIVPVVRTISVNPQTVHGAAHRRYQLSRDWTALLPVLIDETVLADLAPAGADLPALFDATERRTLLPRKHHLLFFDSENPAECYHAGQLDRFPAVALQPMPVGRAHAWGIYEIERSGLVRAALARAARPWNWRDPLGQAWWRE